MIADRVLRSLFLVMLALAATSAVAGNKLYSAGVPIKVAKSPLTVTPTVAWNKLSARPGRDAESWTFDGPALNDLTFYGAVPDNHTLFREVDKRNRPLPRFSKTMLPTDIVRLFETSYRIAADTTLFELGRVEPTKIAGHDGVRFGYAFVAKDEVRRDGEAVGVIIDGQLYLISFEAPAIHYFARDVDKARAVMASAQIG